MAWRRGVGGAVVLVCFARSVGAAPTPAAPKNPDAVNVGGSWRVRAEVWDWFNADTGEDGYSYYGSLLRLSFSNADAKRDWVVELAQPTLIDLPSDAIAPPPQGQLGLGGTYFGANGRRDGSLFIKQGFVRLRRVLGAANQLRLGRFEIVDGAEVVPNDPSLAWVKRERVAHRLLGTFAWSHVGRSFDGGQFTHSKERFNLTFLAARPTEGVFQLDGWQNIPVRVLYGAATLSTPGKLDTRLFALSYRDNRGLLKTDNRPAAARASDQGEIDLNTFGGHYLRLMPVGGGKLDLLLWGAVQTGDWGRQDHRARALAAEVGYQPNRTGLKPWLRAGYYAGSGDNNPADGDHKTFFQVLPTPRIYARFPFYNGMNLQDGFLQAILRPGKRWTLRADAHRLRLSEGADLWYQGGGAFQREGFGYAGRPANGESDFATLLDLSADYTLSPETTLSFYIATARGGDVIERIYPRGKNATFGYVEFTRRW